MKHYVLVCASLILAFCVCLPLVAQPNTKSVETFLIDDFDVPAEREWTWAVHASESVYVNAEEGEVYPKLNYHQAIPNSLTVYREEGDPDPQVLGVQVKFDRKGDNWFEVYPQMTDANGEMQPYEIPFKGSVSQMDFWVWGAKYLYYLDVLVRDSNGQVHVLSAGNLAFDGWRNVIVKIPGWMPQESRLRTGPKSLSFVGFRIRSDSRESVDDFTIFFDQLRYSTYTVTNVFDGFDLLDADFDTASDVNTVDAGGN